MKHPEIPIDITTPTLGVWNGNYNVSKEYADQNHIPMIAYWSPGSGCGYCTQFENYCLFNTTVADFIKNSKYIWCYCTGKSNKSKGKIKGDRLSEYPFVMFYWKMPSGNVIELHFTGRNESLPIASSNYKTIGTQFIQSVNWFFSGYAGPVK